MTITTPGAVSAKLSSTAAAPAKPNTAASPDKANKGEMDQTAFLKLFTTQLQNQNPLEPVKNEAFVAQLAQFSQLEATTKMADSLGTMAAAMKSDKLMTGASLIGKKVASPTGTAELVDGANVRGTLALEKGASAVNLDVFDVNGSKVFSQSLGRQAPGEIDVIWPGYNSKGERMPPGRYNVVATVDAFGTVTKVPISTPSAVRSVSFNAANNELMLELTDGSSVGLSNVQRIDN
jgi:flagellar basal-body rod modification protein FlgD